MSIRVIAGSLKRRTLKTPDGRSTRPTAARVREALFSVLGDLEGLCVLDLYAGSGALGIEALSRGAARALFIESERTALSCIRDNIASLGLGARTSVLPLRVERAPVARVAEGGAIDLVLCDPPWSDVEDAAAAIPGLAPAFADAVRVVLEHPRGRELELEGFVCDDRRHWGDTGVSLFSRSLALAAATEGPDRAAEAISPKILDPKKRAQVCSPCDRWVTIVPGLQDPEGDPE